MKKLDLLDFLKYILDCTYISDLRRNPYINKVKLLLEYLNLKKFSSKEVEDALDYFDNEL